jgi:hypothetical protein
MDGRRISEKIKAESPPSNPEGGVPRGVFRN